MRRNPTLAQLRSTCVKVSASKTVVNDRADGVGALAVPAATTYWFWAGIQVFGVRWRSGPLRAIAATVLFAIMYWAETLALGSAR